jgi:hypothetical protein
VITSPSVGFDVDLELRALEGFAIGVGYLTDEDASSGYLRLTVMGLAINHVTLAGFVDLLFENDARLGGSLSLPLYHLGVPADVALYGAIAQRYETEETDIGVGLEYALW